MLETLQENYQSVFLFKSVICQVELCLFIIVCRIATAISRADSFEQVTLIFTVMQLIYLVML